MRRLASALESVHDPNVLDHPRYRAWERRHVLLAVRGGAVTLVAVHIADSVLLSDQAPWLWMINGAGALGSVGVLWAVRSGGNARRNPVAGAFVLGAIAVATTLLPMAVMPDVAPSMVAYIPIVVIGSALFIPWSIRWHVPWLLAVVAAVGAFAASPLADTLTDAAHQALVSVTISAAVVSFGGHAILQRERRRTFLQRMQLRGVNETVRRQRRELGALAAQLESVARRDPLTGIGNRLRLDEDMAALRSASHAPVRPVAAILLDIDHFKEYNDEHGHLAGDTVLREVARSIAINVRPEDRVYRFGGEEFLILLDGTDADAALEVAERLRAAVEALAIAASGNAPWAVVTASAGVAEVRLADAGSDDWIRSADERLYVSKRAGRNRVTGTPTSDRRDLPRASGSAALARVSAERRRRGPGRPRRRGGRMGRSRPRTTRAAPSRCAS
jgi:diguanylate cyclase (GGDEF)-like protein